MTLNKPNVLPDVFVLPFYKGLAQIVFKNPPSANEHNHFSYATQSSSAAQILMLKPRQLQHSAAYPTRKALDTLPRLKDVISPNITIVCQ
jgi:hypothetical protein